MRSIATLVNAQKLDLITLARTYRATHIVHNTHKAASAGDPADRPCDVGMVSSQGNNTLKVTGYK